MTHKTISILLLATCALLAQSLHTTADTLVAAGNNVNFGSSPTLNVGGVGPYQSLVQFDLSALPAGTTSANVSKAKLVVFVNNIGTPGSIAVNTAVGAWAEGTVNGSTAPALGMTVANAVPVNTAGVYIVIDATAAVKAWLHGTPNQGLILTADPGTPSTSVFFDSKENRATSHPATLHVMLVAGGAACPAGPQGPAGPIGPTGATGSQGPAGSGGGGGTAVLYKRSAFDGKNIPPAAMAPVVLATLIFTPSADGTAVFLARATAIWFRSLAPTIGSTLPLASTR